MKVSYLTWLHEKIGVESEQIQLPDNIQKISELITHLECKGDNYVDAFKNRHVIYVALNDELASHDTAIQDEDNVTFFSAIAGG